MKRNGAIQNGERLDEDTGAALLEQADSILRLLAPNPHIDHAEVFVQRKRSTHIHRRGDIISPRTNADHGHAVRVIIDGKEGYASQTGDRDPRATIEAAIRSARISQAANLHGMAEATDVASRRSDVDDRLIDQDPDRLHGLVNEAYEHVDDPLATYLSVSLTSGNSVFAVSNTNGVATWDRGGKETLLVENRVERTGSLLTGWDGRADAAPLEEQADLPAFLSSLRERTRRALDKEPLTGPRTEAVLAPGPVAQLFQRVSNAFNATLHHQGQSAISGRLGEAIASPTVTLTDRPHGENVIDRMRTDHEGTATRPLTLIDRGVATDIYADHATAMALDPPLTPPGRGIRSRAWHARPRSAAIQPRLEPGSASPESLIENVDRGVYITDPLTGMFTANENTGDFSATLPYAFRIDNGTLGPATTNANLSGNVYEVLKSVHAVANDAQGRTTGTYCTIQCGGLTFST